jgi:hypothetical protein
MIIVLTEALLLAAPVSAGIGPEAKYLLPFGWYSSKSYRRWDFKLAALIV